MWLNLLFGHGRTATRQPGPRGFGEAAQQGFAERPPDATTLRSWNDDPAPPASQPFTGQPFTSIGPDGHRARLREKLLGRGLDALADYELLEMLLFFAFKKGDT
ncbi:MAG: hypothetical protein KGL55_16295, partial [Rhodospirillales bacterium]|nr:hypothetical protein [Rhodospirillales bacterium]